MIPDSHGHELPNLTHKEELHIMAAHPSTTHLLPLAGVAALIGLGFAANAVKGCETAPQAVPAQAKPHAGAIRFERAPSQPAVSADAPYTVQLTK